MRLLVMVFERDALLNDLRSRGFSTSSDRGEAPSRFVP
jgi:hypothetical protein